MAVNVYIKIHKRYLIRMFHIDDVPSGAGEGIKHLKNAFQVYDVLFGCFYININEYIHFIFYVPVLQPTREPICCMCTTEKTLLIVSC